MQKNSNQRRDIIAHDRKQTNSNYARLTVEYEAKQLEAEKRKIEQEKATMELSEAKSRKNEKLRREAQNENNRLSMAEADRLKRKTYWNTPEGRLNKVNIEKHQKTERDIESGMSIEQIRERDELRLGDQRGHKRDINSPYYSAQPIKNFKRRLK